MEPPKEPSPTGCTLSQNELPAVAHDDGDENRNPETRDTLGESSDDIPGSEFFLVASPLPTGMSTDAATEEFSSSSSSGDETDEGESSPSTPPPHPDSDEEQDEQSIPPPPTTIDTSIRHAESSSNETNEISSKRQQSLEERVEELEMKLAVLSKLLPQKCRPHSPDPGRTPPTCRPLPGRFTPHLESPAPGMSSSKRKHCSFEPSNTPEMPLSTESQEEKESTVLDEVIPSPTPQFSTTGDEGCTKPMAITPSQRNLSYTLLYDGNTEAYNKAKPSPVDPQKVASAWSLQPKLLHFHESNASAVAPTIRTKWLDYLNSSFPEGSSDVDRQMQEFIKVPGELESLLGFGFFVCVNSYLSILTVLPVRFLWSCVLLFCTLIKWSGLARVPVQFQFHRRHLYRLIQVLILALIYRYVLLPISIGKLYHWIRGQAMIKLYVIIAMVEIFDRLFSALGQDCLDSLYWNTLNTPGSTRFVISAVVVLVYAALHTLILFVHVATLNVAMNSADQALLTLLISGNFAEIKSTVFKKYNKAALFKITTSDICERFKLSLFLGLVLVLNVSQGMEYSQLLVYLRTCGWVIATEIIADWIKHAFITKFNFINSSVYREYSLLLAGDVTGIGHEGVNLDHSHAVVKRLAFAQIPLVAVMIRLLKEASKYRPCSWSTVAAVWIVLAVAKYGLQTCLHWQSIRQLQAVPDMKQKNN